jgi:predicted PurR-regulated permease PerM
LILTRASAKLKTILRRPLTRNERLGCAIVPSAARLASPEPRGGSPVQEAGDDFMTTTEFARRSAIAIGLALIPLLIWYLFNVVLIVVGAILVASLLQLGAEPFRKLWIPNGLALVASGVIIVIVVAGAAYLFGTGVASEMQEVLRRIGEAQKNLIDSLHQSDFGNMLLSHIQGGNLPITDIISRIFGVSTSFLVAWS